MDMIAKFAPPNTIKGRFYRNMIQLLQPISNFLLRPVLLKVVGVCPQLVQPHSKGTLKLRSTNPNDTPIIDANSFDKPEDLERLVEGIAKSREIAAQEPLKSLIISETSPGTDDVVDVIRRKCGFAWHPVGTCKMGVGDGVVVDPQLRVRGTEKLRVADASIMPDVCSGNTNWTSIMIGAKAAELILSDSVQ